jgi:hypothetical protein
LNSEELERFGIDTPLLDAETLRQHRGRGVVAAAGLFRSGSGSVSLV